jgi:GNAT superfamily N-acetyltransferase
LAGQGRSALLPTVRRLEAAAFRAWPAEQVAFDGTWAIRLTASHPARRLNSINPLDPDDVKDIDARIKVAAQRFAKAGRPLTFRISPLGAGPLSRHLDVAGWSMESESLVCRLGLDEIALATAIDHIPLKDVGRFCASAMTLQGLDEARRDGLGRIIAASPGEAGLFVLETAGRPAAMAVCIHDGDVASLFELYTAPELRGRGHGRRILTSALRWARLRGARQAILQVEAGNHAALALYGSLGFREVYRYHYRQPQEAPT